MPLLPIEEPLVLPTPIVEPPPPPPGPRRKINMTFLPLCESKEDTEAALSPQSQSQTHTAQAMRPSTPTHTVPEPHTPLETVTESGEETAVPSIFPPMSVALTRHTRIPLVLTVPGPTNTPSLSSASDTEPETETDTDTFTDTDAESDFAPSTSTGASSVSSPLCDVDVSEYFFAKAGPSEGTLVVTPSESGEVSEREEQEVRNYFSSVMPLRSNPGMTPPLSALYPSHPLNLGPGHGNGFVPPLKSVRLQALPSPALVPPSPLSLYPPSPGGASGSHGLPGVAVSMTTTTTTTVSNGKEGTTTTATTTKRAFVAQRRSKSGSGSGSGLGFGVQIECSSGVEGGVDFDLDGAGTELEDGMRRGMLSASLSRRRG